MIASPHLLYRRERSSEYPGYIGSYFLRGLLPDDLGVLVVTIGQTVVILGQGVHLLIGGIDIHHAPDRERIRESGVQPQERLRPDVSGESEEIIVRKDPVVPDGRGDHHTSCRYPATVDLAPEMIPTPLDAVHLGTTADPHIHLTESLGHPLDQEVPVYTGRPQFVGTVREAVKIEGVPSVRTTKVRVPAPSDESLVVVRSTKGPEVDPVSEARIIGTSVAILEPIDDGEDPFFRDGTVVGSDDTGRMKFQGNVETTTQLTEEPVVRTHDAGATGGAYVGGRQTDHLGATPETRGSLVYNDLGETVSQS